MHVVGYRLIREYILSEEINKKKAQKVRAEREKKRIQFSSVDRGTEIKLDSIKTFVSLKPASGRWYTRRKCRLIKGVYGQRYRVVSPGISNIRRDTRSGGPKLKISKGC